jgi:hypothetical protein
MTCRSARSKLADLLGQGVAVEDSIMDREEPQAR